MHDRTIEDRVRSTLRAEAEELPFSVTVDELERRLTLRQRGRAGRRRGLLAAAVAAIVVGGALLVASNPFRATQVATTPEPTTGPTAAPTISATAAASVDPTSSSSVDPVSLLAALEPSADAVDSKVTTQPGDPTSTDTEPGGLGLDHVRQNAREVGIKVVCLGPDQLYVSWEVVQRDDPTRIADQLIPCDNSVASFRYDISARQPLIDDALIVFATPRTSYRVLVETFGSTNVPTPVGLPGLATPGGTTLAEASETLGSSAATTTKVGTVPVRALYRVAMVCNETQPATSKPARATWSIGRIGTGGLVDQATIPCDGAPYGVSSSAGLASGDRDVYVTADPHAVWRIALTDPYGPIGFIPPSLNLWLGNDTTGATSGPAQCVGYDGNGDSCGLELGSRDGARVVTTASGGRVSLRVDGSWTIEQASVHVADRAAIRKDPTSATYSEFAVLDDGSGRLTGSGDRMSLSVAGLTRRDWIVIVTIQCRKGGHTFGATYQLPLRVE